jgi:hypothetical protein
MRIVVCVKKSIWIGTMQVLFRQMYVILNEETYYMRLLAGKEGLSMPTVEERLRELRQLLAEQQGHATEPSIEPKKPEEENE